MPSKIVDRLQLPDDRHGERLPCPNGWFAAAFSAEVKKGGVITSNVGGDEVVVYRTRSGDPRVAKAYCPHLGAHVGVGGRVEGETLVCPFHQFAFDGKGACVRTSYGRSVPRATLPHFVVRETCGVILVWLHKDAVSPSYEPLSMSLDGFPPFVYNSYRIRAHPQEIVENAVDLGHIGPVHGYSDLRQIEEMRTSGPSMTITSSARRRLPTGHAVEVQFAVEAMGLGLVWVRAEIPQLRTAARFQLMATPVGGWEVDLRFAVSLRTGDSQNVVSAALSHGITRMLSPLFWRDIRKDFPIWEHKVYLARPHLAKGDGPIAPFRRWAQQCYGAPTAQS